MPYLRTLDYTKMSGKDLIHLHKTKRKASHKIEAYCEAIKVDRNLITACRVGILGVEIFFEEIFGFLYQSRILSIRFSKTMM